MAEAYIHDTHSFESIDRIFECSAHSSDLMFFAFSQDDSEGEIVDLRYLAFFCPITVYIYAFTHASNEAWFHGSPDADDIFFFVVVFRA